MKLSNNFKQSKSIIDYIPIFLKYCKNEKHFSPNSTINYYRFLKVFVDFLKTSNNETILPYQLDTKVIQNYKSFISTRINLSTKKPLKKSTLNYYLIALRSLLKFLNKNNINTLKSDEIRLIKEKKSILLRIILSQKQIKILKAASDTTKLNGLRNRAIIELLLSTGLKVSQITNLNRNQIVFSSNSKYLKVQLDNKLSTIFLSDNETIYWLKEYLKNRNDDEKALFINYQSRKNASRRLTNRSIEKIINKYASDNNLPSITPETLRNTSILSVYDKKIRIHLSFLYSHKYSFITSYKYVPNTFFFKQQSDKKSIKSWNTIEKRINKELLWLKKKIDVMPFKYRNDRLLSFCDECLFRKIAILIISGKVKATEYKNKKNLWNIKTNLLQVNEHGKEWHQKMMKKVANYFKKQNNKVILEPVLSYGRADLGVYTKSKNLIIIEIGTVSLLKLWYNLSTTKDVTYLIIPYENYIIEFKV